jgi:hypothetical protein
VPKVFLKGALRNCCDEICCSADVAAWLDLRSIDEWKFRFAMLPPAAIRPRSHIAASRLHVVWTDRDA